MAGKFANNVESVLRGASLNGVSIRMSRSHQCLNRPDIFSAIVVGLLVMMWPILTKGRQLLMLDEVNSDIDQSNMSDYQNCSERAAYGGRSSCL